jgi:hypothetical protein
MYVGFQEICNSLHFVMKIRILFLAEVIRASKFISVNSSYRGGSVVANTFKLTKSSDTPKEKTEELEEFALISLISAFVSGSNSKA